MQMYCLPLSSVSSLLHWLPVLAVLYAKSKHIECEVEEKGDIVSHHTHPSPCTEFSSPSWNYTSSSKPSAMSYKPSCLPASHKSTNHIPNHLDSHLHLCTRVLPLPLACTTPLHSSHRPCSG